MGGVLFAFCGAATRPATAQTAAPLTFSLPALELRDAAAAKNSGPVTLGGPDNKKARLRLDADFVRRVVVEPGDILEAGLSLKVLEQQGELSGATFSVYRALKASTNAVPVVGVDYDARPLAVLTLPDVLPGNRLKPSGLTVAVRTLMGAAADFGFILGLEGKTGARPQLSLAGLGAEADMRPALSLSVKARPNALLFEHPVKPRAGVYNTMKNGHFDYGGQRLRLWGVVGNGSADRLRKMGFNAQRVWDQGAGFYDGASAKTGKPTLPKKGDGSKADRADKQFAELKAAGMFVMFASLSGSGPIQAMLVDDSFIAGGDDWPAWKKALSEAKDAGAVARSAIFFDERLQRIKKQHAANLLNHVNPYTGKKYGEDEANAVYEVWNENGFVKRVMEKGLNLPPVFQDKAQNQWNGWLKARYKDEAGLKTAWGTLKEGESLDGASVKLAPSLAQRAEYPAARAGDYVRFLLDKVNAFNEDFRAHCRAQAPQGVGVNVAPFSFDTQYQPSLQWAYAQSRGDVNSFGMYFWDVKSSLSSPPGMYVMDSHTVEGKATVIYETNQSRPDPYRAEYPFKLAALASWQDWDAVFWHYWSGGGVKTDEGFLTQSMPYVAEDHYWTGVHHDKDPVMDGAMALAGRIFLGEQLKPAPAPKIVEVGSEALFGFKRANGVGLGQAAFSSGAKLRFTPESPTDVRVNGAALPESERIREAIRMGDEVVWDWPNSRLVIDAPQVKVYVGKTAPSHRFKDGTTLSGFNTPFIAWAMVSGDGKPLSGPNATTRAYVSGLFDARNTGFDYDWSVTGGGPIAISKATSSWGRAPVVVDKVNYTVSFPQQLSSELAAYDFALRETGRTPMRASNVLRVGGDTWMNLLNVQTRGAAAQPIVDASSGAAVQVGTGETTLAAPALREIFHPLPGVTWGMNFGDTHRVLRESPTVFVSISANDASNAPLKVLTWSGAEAIFKAPANIDVSFQNGRMSRIEATFTRPPPLGEAVALYEKKFGAALEKTLDKAQFETNKARWLVKNPAANLEITLTQSQGELKAIYELKDN